jgi:hypothetical protein
MEKIHSSTKILGKICNFKNNLFLNYFHKNSSTKPLEDN